MARERLLPTLTWHPKGLTQPWPGQRHMDQAPPSTEPLLEAAPAPSVSSPPHKGPSWGPQERASGTDSVHHCGEHSRQEELMVVPQAWGQHGKDSLSSWLGIYGGAEDQALPSLHPMVFFSGVWL